MLTSLIIFLWIFAVTLLCLCDMFHRFHRGLFARIGVKGPFPWPLIGNLDIFLHTSSLEKRLQKLQDRFGDVYGVYIGSLPVLVVNDVQVVREVLGRQFNKFQKRRLKSPADLAVPFDRMLSKLHGQDWKKTRTVIMSMLSLERMNSYHEHMKKASKEFEDECNKMADSETALDIFKLFRRYTMDVMIYASLGASVDDSLRFEIQLATAKAAKRTTLSTCLTIAPFVFPPWICRWLPNAFIFRFDKMLNICNRIFKREIECDIDNSNTFVGYLLKSQKNSIKNDLSDHDVQAQILQVLFSGYETDSVALASAVYYLARHSTVQEKLRREIDDTYGISGLDSNVDVSRLGGMVYLEAVILETMRMLSPGLLTIRQSSEDCKINGISIKKNTGIVFPVHLIHKDERYWNEPQLFEPDRFMPGQKERNIPGAYLAFGHGPRQCVGMRLAMLKMKYILVKLILKFSILPPCNNEDDTDFVVEIHSVCTPKDVLVRLQKRK